MHDAAEESLAAARVGSIVNRSGDRYKPSTLRGYEETLHLRVLPITSRALAVPIEPPGELDTDGDGVPNLDDNCPLRSNPEQEDFDEDGLGDACDPDDDDDGLSDAQEEQEGTDPLDPDTDDDGVSDGDEVAAGTDPLDPESS